MNICLNCNNVFEDGEERRWAESCGEDASFDRELSGCPCCGEGYTEAGLCDGCDEPFAAEKLYGGHYCETCLRRSINHYTGLDFMCDNNYLVPFMMEDFYESSVPEKVSPKLYGALRERFLRMKTDDQIRNVKEFLNLIRSFILDGDGEVGRHVYAEWLWKKTTTANNEKEVNNG